MRYYNWYEYTTEPALLVFSFAICTYSTVVQNYILQKACNPSVDPDFNNECNSTHHLAFAREMETLRKTIGEVVSVGALFLAGCARDSTGFSKPMMYVALMNEIIGITLEVLFLRQWSVSLWKACASAAVFHGIGGGSNLFYLGAACIVTDQSIPENRTARLTMNLAAALTGACLSTGFSSYYLRHINYKTTLILIMILLLITFAIVVFISEDGSKRMKSENWNICEKLQCMFKSRPNRGVICLMILSSALMGGVAKAEDNLSYYYLHEGFSFTIQQVGFYSTYRLMIAVASAIVLPRLFSTFLKKSEFNKGTACAVVAAIFSAAMALSRTKPELLSVTLLGFTKCFLLTIPKSAGTRIVEDNEIGIYLSLCYIGECILPLCFFYIYDSIFAYTMDKTPGTFYLSSAIVFLILIIFYRIAHSIYHPSQNKPVEENLENCDHCQKKKVKF